ncbi:helix-turn-helix domain-containing protein [Litorihabitans aurantiacus]|uniref:Uncharacterized protein n=1 Tax=Litorihabitans aurantiacus TaxID=1930061 RepID=A0AA38CXP6_9MICO|nr:helix-turn-helix transcriptional regulator [Litorihabitans aurantiacus]GMA33536.1 hypothetical protein GCM10025875_35280 [Litorihabitans aurantiacus]GMA33612.1 hypothetical protein GCM10025875_36040 [Litorihabitans aurantiacus]
MEQNIARLGRYLRSRRAELGFSQDEVAALGGPSTTTQSKIEHGLTRRIQRRTMEDIDRSLGWKVGSTEALLEATDDDVEPVAVRRPATNRDGKRPHVAARPEPSGGTWTTLRREVDAKGRSLVVGVSVDTDVEGVETRVEVRYWPGPDRDVDAFDFNGVVGEAHRSAIRVTSVYRQPTEEDPILAAGPAPVPMSEPDGYVMAARDVDDDAEAEAQQVDP